LQGHEDVSPISPPAHAALGRYLRAHPRVGDVWMFPQPKHPGRPINATLARALLKRAEKLAELPPIERGGYHAYRRAYASERKHLPDVDVARSAGWRDPATTKRSYQHPDPLTTLRVIENEPETGLGGHTADTPQKASGGTPTA